MSGHDAGGGLRWLLTYADLITLLLVFFIIAYASANQETKKAEEMAEAMASAFKMDERPFAVEGEGAGKNILSRKPAAGTTGSPSLLEQQISEVAAKEEIEISLVRFYDRQLAIDMRPSVLFEADGISLKPKSEEFLQRVAQVMKDHTEKLTIASYRTIPLTAELAATDVWDLTASQTHMIAQRLASYGASNAQLSSLALGMNASRIGAQNGDVDGITFLFLRPNQE